MKKKYILVFLLLGFFGSVSAQENLNNSKFKQLDEQLPTPNTYRTGSGAPGHEYWQQQADYIIKVELDEKKHTITASETITYHNNAPESLTYLWLQLDQNVRAPDADSYATGTGTMDESISMGRLKRLNNDFEGGYKISNVKDKSGKPLKHQIIKTMMRIELPAPLKRGEKFTFSLDWFYNINNQPEIGGRAGYEFFEKDGNYLYEMAQWFPRMCVYDDFNGWQNKQFLGRGEFALAFGDYEVQITVPADHIVASTGVLQNPKDVLTDKQRNRFEKAKTSDKPVLIVTQEEAEENEKEGTDKKKTWIYKAENVRDFAWASSRKFIWDAMGVKVGGKNVMAMSYYPKEGNPLWGQYSTEVVAHTIEVYSKFTIDYPYPVAISVHGPVYGMEYPMISFNGGRPEADGTYSSRTKYGMISVIIHEVGHNFFPMIINSDERQWTWMDEGLNTFVQYLSQVEWQRDYPSRRGPAYGIVDYMKGDHEDMMPIMTNSESILQFGNNAYGKPATALNILRETVMGREVFDYAFKEYCRRWAFKHPKPADFFRTMEDASGIDLDWFWRGWFYTTDRVNFSLSEVKLFRADELNPELQVARMKKERDNEREFIGDIRNKEDIKETRVERKPELNDFYNTYDPLEVTDQDRRRFEWMTASLSDKEKEMLASGKNYYEITFENKGGLVMPIILEFEYEDGTKEIIRIPAEVWKRNNEKISKVFPTDKLVKNIVLDPLMELADVDLSDNYFPRRPQPTRFEIFKYDMMNRGDKNPMQIDRDRKGKSEKKSAEPEMKNDNSQDGNE